jgi:SAM-dependent methyltransferase
VDRPSAASIFNGYVLAHALFGLWESGLLDQLSAQGQLEVTDLPAAGVAELLDPLVAAGLATKADDAWRLTPAGVEATGEVGFFVWAIGGYGRVFQNAAGILTGRQRYGRDVSRDDGQVVTGSALAAHRHVAPYVYRIVDRLHATSGLRRVVDVGCGNASFLIELCHRYADVSAVGVDISPTACELAVENVRRAKLTERITISCTNFRAVAEAGRRGDAIWADTGMVTSFFMLHDLMSDVDRTVRDLRALRDYLPADARLLFADTVRWEPGDEPLPPIFSLGYHLAHALMGVRLWSVRDYEEVFDAAGLSVERRIPTSVPATWVYLLR